MSLQLAAQHLASKGRGPDTTLVHMAPHEVAGLQALARAQGGSLTINPDTGLAEAGFLSDLFKAALPVAAGWALGPAGFGLMSSLGAGATVGGISALASGSLSKGITAGLGAYGGSELASGLSSFGAEDAAMKAVPSLTSGADAAATQQYANQFTAARDLAGADKLGSVFGGAKAAMASPSAFAGSMGGFGNVAKTGLMAAAPLLSLAPKTEMPNVGGSDSGYIRPFKYDPQTQRYTAETPIRADQYGSRMASGGAVETTTKMPAMTGDSAAAYNYLMGLGPNPLVDTSAPKPKPIEKAKDTVTGAADATGIAAILPISETGGGNDAGQPGGGWGGKDVSDKAGFWGENKGWAGLHEKMLGFLPDSQAKRDEQLAIDMSRTIGPSTTTAEEQATKNTLADQMRAAEHGTVAPTGDGLGGGISGPTGVSAGVGEAGRGGMGTGSFGYGREGDAPAGPSGTGGGGKSGNADVDIGVAAGDVGGDEHGADREANGGMVGQYAMGGITALAQGGMSGLGSYSDGGRLLRGPGDGVSDSIPAHIGRNMQPARLADGEFVVPARIVSELGNGSTEAGARQLYKMMERIQAGRAKTTGKNKVAVNSRAAKHLPA